MATHRPSMPIVELRLARRAGVLNLRGQGLTSLPFKVQNVQGLKNLYLGGNAFTTFPIELAGLRGLQVLELEDNQLEELPEDIRLFGSLQQLGLSGNRLKSLPAALGPLLRRGLRVSFDNNPVLELYPELLNRDSASLAAYIESLSDGVPQYEAKMLLVGEGNVGKTSLVASLLAEPFVKDRPTTHGIEINALRVPHPRMSRTITLRAWDFGGQEVYKITHQFFFSQRALYLVVWNPREGQEQNEVEGWLRRIRLRTGSDASALIVATHCTERAPEIDYPRLRSSFPGILTGQCSVDNHTGDGIAELKHLIARTASRLPQMGLILSERWAAARESILARSEHEPEISFAEFEGICIRTGVSEQEVPTLANLLHDLGQIVYYGDDDGLKDIVVLNPEWLTKAIGFVLEDRATRNNNGVLDHRRLPDIWTDGPDGSSYPSRYYPYFLRLMEKFDVSYRIDDEEHKSLVAQLVAHQRPHLPWYRNTSGRTADRAVRLICRLSEAAPGLIAWLTVRHHRASARKHWRHGVFLRHPIAAYESEALLELQTDSELYLEVRAPSPDLFFNVLRDSVEELITRRWPGLTYELLIPCPTTGISGGCRGAFPLEGLVKLRQRGKLLYDCLDCNRDHDVSELLTGFKAPAPAVDIEDVQEVLAEIADDVKAIGAFATESAALQRRTLKAVAVEVTDCPRLFSLRERTSTLHRLSFWKRAYSLRLWCEHPSAWHPCSSDYHFDRRRDWVNQIAPYARLSLKALHLVVPIAAATAGVLLSSSTSESIKDELELMKTLVDKTPSDVQGAATEDIQQRERLTPAEGEALRQFRYLLFSIDQSQSFGGLRRVQASSGEFIWVCSDHYGEYDPGLPVMPTNEQD